MRCMVLPTLWEFIQSSQPTPGQKFNENHIFTNFIDWYLPRLSFKRPITPNDLLIYCPILYMSCYGGSGNGLIVTGIQCNIFKRSWIKVWPVSSSVVSLTCLLWNMVLWLTKRYYGLLKLETVRGAARHHLPYLTLKWVTCKYSGTGQNGLFLILCFRTVVF